MEERSEELDREDQESGMPSPEVSARARPRPSRAQPRRETPAAAARLPAAATGFPPAASRTAAAAGRLCARGVAMSRLGANTGEPVHADSGRNGAPRLDENRGDEQEGDGGQKRRRRRRRRRGRGRGQGAQDGQGAPQGAPGEASSNNEPEDFERAGDSRDDDSESEREVGRESGSVDREDDRDEVDDRDDREAKLRRETTGKNLDRVTSAAKSPRSRCSDATKSHRTRIGKKKSARDEAASHPSGESTGVREDREDRDFDRELRGIEARAARQVDAIDEDDVHERDAGETQNIDPRAHVVDAAAGAEDATSELPEPAASAGESKSPPNARRRPSARAVELRVEARRRRRKPPLADDVAPPEAEEKPKKPRRGQRGGKGRGRARQAPAETAAAKPSPAESRRQRSAQPVAAAPHKQLAAEPPIVRTGSADRHLADEEPVLHEPVRRLMRKRPRHGSHSRRLRLMISSACEADARFVFFSASRSSPSWGFGRTATGGLPRGNSSSAECALASSGPVDGAWSVSVRVPYRCKTPLLLQEVWVGVAMITILINARLRPPLTSARAEIAWGFRTFRNIRDLPEPRTLYDARRRTAKSQASRRFRNVSLSPGRAARRLRFRDSSHVAGISKRETRPHHSITH